MWQHELYRATIENCTTERGWAHNQAQKIANEHHTHENRVPLYLADLQNGNPWLEETIIDHLNKFEPEKNSGHDFTSTLKCGCGHSVDGVDVVAEEEECINIKQTIHPKESELKLYCHASYHPINLKHSFCYLC